MMQAAATALHLAADRKITAYRRLANVIQPPRSQVHLRRRPARSVPQRLAGAVDQAEAAMHAARTNPAAASQLLTLFTFDWDTLTRFEEQRAYLFRAGIPATFLPSAAKLGRTDLT